MDRDQGPNAQARMDKDFPSEEQQGDLERQGAERGARVLGGVCGGAKVTGGEGRAGTADPADGG